MNSNVLTSKAEQYFYSMNPLAKRIGEDITATKEAYEGLWNTLSVTERNQAINETIIQPEVALKYTLKKIELTKELPEWYPKLRIQTGMKYVIDETGSVSITVVKLGCLLFEYLRIYLRNFLFFGCILDITMAR